MVEIAGGTYASLALRNDGTIVAWGANFANQTNVPAGFSNAVSVAAGSFHSLAIRNDGTVVAWGSGAATNVPPGLSNVVAIAGGSSHSLALRNNGTVVAWGDDSATNVPPGLSNVVAVAAGGFHSLALKNDGTVTAWGDSSAGQTNVPFGLTNVVAIAGGNLHSLALTPFFNANPTNPVILILSNGIPQTNTVGANGVIYYQVNVPTNADFATNQLLSADSPLNIWFTTNPPPALDTLLLPGVTNGVSILSTTSMPTNIVPGFTYYLGVQNTNTTTVTYGIEVDFHLLIRRPWSFPALFRQTSMAQMASCSHGSRRAMICSKCNGMTTLAPRIGPRSPIRRPSVITQMRPEFRRTRNLISSTTARKRRPDCRQSVFIV